MSRGRGAGRFKIGEAAQRLGVTTRTLRFYQELGLLEPPRSEGGTRLYDDTDLERGAVILRLAGLGVPLEEIRALTRIRPGSPDGDRASHRVSDHLAKLAETVEAQKRRVLHMEGEIQKALAQVARCFGCEKPPTEGDCRGCRVGEHLSGPQGSEIFRLIWDREKSR